MDFKRNQFKIKDKHDFDIPNHPPHSHLQKRLEAFLKTSPFKMSSAQSLVKQSNVLKFIKSLNPILTARKSLKFSIFQALKHHMLTTSHYKKGMANRKFDLIKQMKEMIGIIQFVKEKPCSIIRSKFNKPKNKMIKFAEILMKINDKNELYKEKTRHFFHRWRLISFESSLRKISAYHGEIIQKQVIDQFSNLFLSVVRRFIKPSFDKIVSYTKRKNQSLWSSKSFRPKLQREAFSLCILLNFMKEKIKYSIFLGFGKLRQNIDGKNGFPLKDDKKRISKGKMLFFVMKNIFKARLLIFFQKLQSKKQFFSVPIPIPPENLSINLLQIFKLIKYKEDFQKQYAFSTIIEYNDSLQIFKKTKKTFLQKLFLSMKVKILSEVLKKWSIISIKTKDPIITTKQKHSNIEKPSENPENMKINRWIMINQAMVNKELESQQKKKTSKLLNLNKELGLIEISVLFARKQKLFTRIFFNNFKILGTFEPKRYQEFEHYLKILQEEKVIKKINFTKEILKILIGNFTR